MGIGTRIRLVRESLAFSNLEFADKLDISPGTLSGLENEIRDPSTKVVVEVIDKFNVNPTWLLKGEGSMLGTDDELIFNPKLLNKIIVDLDKILEKKVPISSEEKANWVIKAYQICAINNVDADAVSTEALTKIGKLSW